MSPFYLTDADLQPEEKTVSILLIAENLMNDYGVAFNEVYRGQRFSQKIETLRIADLRVETAYQRNPNVPHILRIHDNFDPKSAMLPLVIRRRYNGGELVLPDSQQRVVALAMLGFTTVDCMVVEVTSIQQESDIFRIININRKAVPTPVTHRNDVMGRVAPALALERAIREAGYTIAEKAGNCTIKGIARLHATAKAYGYPMLSNALVTYRTIWPDHDNVHLYLTSGITMLLWTYLSPESPTYSADTERDVEPDLLAARISRHFATSKSAAENVAPEIKELKDAQPWRSGGRLNDTFRRENDLHYAKSLILAFNHGRLGKVRKLEFDRLWQTYTYFKTRSKKKTDSDSSPQEVVMRLLGAE